MIASSAVKRIKPFKRRVDDMLETLSKDGFRIADGFDLGWFGDGMYILTSSRVSLRTTRSRREEFLEIAFTNNPSERDWFGVAELMVAIGDITLEDAMSGRVVPHDLDFKLEAYLRIRAQVDAQLGRNPATNAGLLKVRHQSGDYAQQKYGRRLKRGSSSDRKLT